MVVVNVDWSYESIVARVSGRATEQDQDFLIRPLSTHRKLPLVEELGKADVTFASFKDAVDWWWLFSHRYVTLPQWCSRSLLQDLWDQRHCMAMPGSKARGRHLWGEWELSEVELRHPTLGYLSKDWYPFKSYEYFLSMSFPCLHFYGLSSGLYFLTELK